MIYSISDVAKHFNISAHTLRFYDKEGLLPFITKNKNGKREFTESDLEWVRLVCCLKNTGMKIKEIRKYMDWCVDGEETISLRKQMFIEHRNSIIQHMVEMQGNLQLIDKKIAFYETPELMKTYFN